MFQAVDRGDVGMIQRRQHFRFALKTGEPFGIMRERFGQNFDGHIARELGVVRLIHLSHAACANGGGDLVRSQLGAGVQQEIPLFARDFGWRLGRRQSAPTSPIPPAQICETTS